MTNNDTPQGGTTNPPTTVNPNPNANSGDQQLDQLTLFIQQVNAKMAEANQLIQKILDRYPSTDPSQQGKFRGNTRVLMNKGALMMNTAPGLFVNVNFNAAKLYHRGLQIDGLELVVSSAKKLGAAASQLLGSVKSEAGGMTNDLTDGIKYTINNPLGDKDTKQRMSDVSAGYLEEVGNYSKGLKTSRDTNQKLRDSSNDVLTQKDAEIERLMAVNQVLVDGTLPAATPGPAQKAVKPKKAAKKSSKKKTAPAVAGTTNATPPPAGTSPSQARRKGKR